MKKGFYKPSIDFFFYYIFHLDTNAGDCSGVSRGVRSVNLGNADALPSLRRLGLHVPVGVTQDDLADVRGVILEVDEGDGVGLVIVASLVCEVRRGKLGAVLRTLFDLNIPALFLRHQEENVKR